MSDTTNGIFRIIIILLAALIFVVGCSNEVKNNEQQKITGQNLKKLVEHEPGATGHHPELKEAGRGCFMG